MWHRKLFSVREPNRALRNSLTQLSRRVISNTTHGAKSIVKKSLEIWENIPNEIKQAPSLNSFKKMFKSHLILTNYPSWAQCVQIALPYQSSHCVCVNLIYFIVVFHFADFWINMLHFFILLLPLFLSNPSYFYCFRLTSYYLFACLMKSISLIFIHFIYCGGAIRFF